jgi:hypothetical protein
MLASDLKTLIKECVAEVLKEEFGDEGQMQAVNVREAKDIETKPLGAYGSAAFFESEQSVVSILNQTGTQMNVTVQKFGNSVYLRLDK